MGAGLDHLAALPLTKPPPPLSFFPRCVDFMSERQNGHHQPTNENDENEQQLPDVERIVPGLGLELGRPHTACTIGYLYRSVQPEQLTRLTLHLQVLL